jgi:tRNAHis guanylyltransferase
MIRYEYVKAFEQPDLLLPNTWIVVRIDGRGFHKWALSPFSAHSYSQVIDFPRNIISRSQMTAGHSIS